MKGSQIQTPKPDQNSANRQPKSSSEFNKNLRKVTKKSLNPAFGAVSEDDSSVLESLKELSEVKSLNPAFGAVSEYDSSILESLKELSEVIDENIVGESAEDFAAVDTSSLETFIISDLTSRSTSPYSVTNSYKPLAINETNAKIHEGDSLNKILSVEADVVIKHLEEARIQLLKSNDVGHSKKLLEALLNIIIEEFRSDLYEEKGWLDKLLSKKFYLVLLIVGMGMLILLISLIFSGSSMESITTPPPT